jgi:hypothetical protein
VLPDFLAPRLRTRSEESTRKKLVVLRGRRLAIFLQLPGTRLPVPRYQRYRISVSPVSNYSGPVSPTSPCPTFGSRTKLPALSPYTCTRTKKRRRPPCPPRRQPPSCLLSRTEVVCPPVSSLSISLSLSPLSTSAARLETTRHSSTNPHTATFRPPEKSRWDWKERRLVDHPQPGHQRAGCS